MVWNDAHREAQTWVASMKLPCVRGKVIDLRDPARDIPFVGSFRRLVLRAASRQLIKEGASVIQAD